MSDCSTKAMKPKEPSKTCGTCGISVSEIQKITGCHYQQGIELYNRILEHDNDKLEQLEQVAKDMLSAIWSSDLQWVYQEQLRKLGVSLDD